MYIVKPNGNYNVVISDLDVTISAGSNGKPLTDDEVKSSGDIHRLVDAGYLILTKSDSTEPTKVEEASEPVPTAFVSHATETTNPSDVFIAHEEDLKARVAEDKIIAEENKAKILEPVEVVELKQEATEAVETNIVETTAENKEVPKKEAKTEAKPKSTSKSKATADKKATAKKTSTKKAAGANKSSKA